ncbi:MAG TPA: hypothetical protein VME63_14605 [Dyella sp.]|uniref:hypothetical protein n=1 Tax=Dyella sp. TaxID=1869338 RepID=UPI002CFF11D2|nr:hypothetical protein [Dyella sp.]HTV86628.1 hypothetical protein [Dyella sp.]
MKTFKLATWNLQKGPALEDFAKSNFFAAAARSARYQVLGGLIRNSDIVFVQEPPVEIRQETQQVDFANIEAQEQVWSSYNQEADNQAHKSANRPAYYSQFAMRLLEVPSDCPANGSEDAFRLSAMGWAVTALGEAIFVSLHATSGYGAKRNTTEFLKWLAKWVPDQHRNVRFVLIGADFNHTPNPTSYKVENCSVEFSLPTQMTQQSGNAIDGFCCLIVDPAITVKWQNSQRVCTGECAGAIETKMVQVNPNILQAVNQRGYLGKLTAGPLAGTSAVLSSDMWVRMSDHCAVVGAIDISCPD